jgi:hypothetical protein
MQYAWSVCPAAAAAAAGAGAVAAVTVQVASDGMLQVQ